MAFTGVLRVLVCAAAFNATALATEAATAVTRIGAPYEAGGVWFVPAADTGYDEEGLAGVYGEAMTGQRTASGERYDPDALSAAHATLPLPGVVEVTNLATGKVLKLRINDRGPYVPGRILSLTPASARALGIRVGEASRVRVRYPQAARSVAAAARPAQAGALAVQVGAFSERARADRVARDLASAGAVRVDTVERGDATLFRVTVGPMRDQAGAEKALSRIEGMGYAAARVVPAL